jgi:hypothetical protein
LENLGMNFAVFGIRKCGKFVVEIDARIHLVRLEF